MGDFTRARSAVEEGYRLAQDIGALNVMAVFTGLVKWVSYNLGDLTIPAESYEKGLFLFQQAGNQLGELMALQVLGMLFIYRANTTRQKDISRKFCHCG